MKILIADDVLAGSSGLRAFFDSRSKGAKAGAKSKTKNSGSSEWELAFAGPKGKAKRAAAMSGQSFGIRLSDQPEQLAAILDAIGIALLNRGCLREGGECIERALEIRRKAFGPDHPFTGLSLTSYARLLRERGDVSGA